MPTAEQLQSASAEEPENQQDEESSEFSSGGGVEVPLETEVPASEDEVAEIEAQAAAQLSKEVPTSNPEKQSQPVAQSPDIKALMEQNQKLLQERYDTVIGQQNAYLQQLGQQNQQLQQQLAQFLQAQTKPRTEDLSPEEQAKLSFIDELKKQHLSPEMRRAIDAEVGPIKAEMQRLQNERFAAQQKATLDGAMAEVSQGIRGEIFKDLDPSTYDVNFVRDMEDLTLTFAAARTNGKERANFLEASKVLAKVLDSYHKSKLRSFAKAQAAKQTAEPQKQVAQGGRRVPATKHADAARVKSSNDRELTGSIAQQLEQAMSRIPSEFNA